ncbi:MAG: NAD(P)H-dependent oxidoreductase [Candidatus Komeilibacteria bacterium]
MSKTFIDNLEWRFATKKFDPAKKVDQTTLDNIIKAIRFTPSSYGMQPYHIYIISDQGLKDKMKTITFMQPQAAGCSQMLVFCARTDLKDRVDQYIEDVSKGNLLAKTKLQAKKLLIINTIGKKSEEDLLEWSKRQTYIALGFAVAVCAELQVDSCPMEGFNAKAMNKLLDLPEYMTSVVLLPIGYRAEDPQHDKFRYSKEDLFTKV